jgi:hypothetical protein
LMSRSDIRSPTTIPSRALNRLLKCAPKESG